MSITKTVLHERIGDNLFTIGEIPKRFPSISNDNLIDNSNFKINQRGLSTYPNLGKEAYSVDRCMAFRGTLNVNESGINFVSESTAFYKRFISKTEYSLMFGEVVTISMTAKVNQVSGHIQFRIFDGTDYGGQAGLAIQSTTDGYEEFSVTVTANRDYHNVGIEVLVADTENDYLDIDIKHWKMELGSQSTSFIEPNPSIEILKCQRYFQRLILVGGGLYFPGLFDKRSVDVEVPLTTTMRVLPTINFEDDALIIAISHDNIILNLSDPVCYSYTHNSVTIRFSRNYSDGETECGACVLRARSNTYLELSAEV